MVAIVFFRVSIIVTASRVVVAFCLSDCALNHRFSRTLPWRLNTMMYWIFDDSEKVRHRGFVSEWWRYEAKRTQGRRPTMRSGLDVQRNNEMVKRLHTHTYTDPIPTTHIPTTHIPTTHHESDPSAPLAAQKLATLRFRPAVIKGYKRYCVKGAAYPGLLPTGIETDRVIGVLCEGLTKNDILRLDNFEGGDYTRIDTTVDTLATPSHPTPERGVSVGVYVWTSGRHELEEREWDFEDFVRHKQESWLVCKRDGGFEE
ncbi:hypothetical protein BC938DRAFT_471878 [Jimgerdemannia flammicorona]|uniref:Putative gamma-glutamylcyclotransferase n=1 Tax=Jimgerdemannia flammicorona TaxID=994334 RepID=A0A433QUD7_9FUNG|nr:hypothetical protein BC938DRAFT_471878 [Jimgerdemannia flammicorona]